MDYFAFSGLISCTAGDVVEPTGQENEYVELHVQAPAVGNRIDTRASEENLPAGATVRVVAYQRPSGKLNVPVDYAVTAPTAQATYVVNADGTLTQCTVDADGKKRTVRRSYFMFIKELMTSMQFRLPVR